jgi:hypothetical protein
MSRVPKGMKIDDIVLGQSYAAQHDYASPPLRYEAVDVEPVKVRTYSGWAWDNSVNYRNVRHVKVNVWDGDTLVETRHMLARDLRGPYEDRVEELRLRAARDANTEDAMEALRTSMEKALGEGGWHLYRSRTYSSIDLNLTPDAAHALSKALT